MSRIFVFLAFAIPVAVISLCWKAEITAIARDFMEPAPTSPEFASTCLQSLNERRQRVGSKPLTGDADIQSYLEGFLASVPNASDIDLDVLLRNLQQNHPNVTALSATIMWHPASTGLATEVANWQDGVGREFETLSAVVFRDGYRRGCIGVLAHRLPMFNLASANRDGGKFHHDCPRCGAGHAIELARTAHTVQLRCPHCHRPYDILASDSEGKFHRAPSFLTGFVPPAPLAATNSTPEEQVAALWQLVTSRCRYQADGSDVVTDHEPTNTIPRHRSSSEIFSGAEAWQTPAETWQRKAGDCEDTSLLLTDILISKGFDARVALGWNAQGGDHAWCVVRLDDGSQYILESTLTPSGPLRLLPVTDAGAAYRPEQLFDRGKLYFPIGNGPANDYWSSDIWSTVTSAPSALHQTAMH